MQLNISVTQIAVGDTVLYEELTGKIIALTVHKFTVDWFGWADPYTYDRWDAKERGFRFVANI